MAIALGDFEDRSLRGMARAVKIGNMFERTYNIPPLQLSLVPAKGAIMPEYDPDTAVAEGLKSTTDECFQPRVFHVGYGKQAKGANKVVKITYIQILPVGS
jgi:hypothetical protein